MAPRFARKSSRNCSRFSTKSNRCTWPTNESVPSNWSTNFTGGQRPQPNPQGRIATTLEWAKPLSQEDMGLLAGKGAFGQTVPDVDQGFTQADLQKGSEAV